MGFLVGGAMLIGFWGGSVGMEQGIERVGRWCNGEAVVALPVVGTGVWWELEGLALDDGVTAVEEVSSLLISSLLGPSSCFSSVVRLASRSVTWTFPNSFCNFASRSSYDSVNVLDSVLIVSEVQLVGFQSIGQKTACLATAWQASRRRRASRTLRPTVRLFSMVYEHVSNNAGVHVKMICFELD
jgi:hypothetical protein